MELPPPPELPDPELTDLNEPIHDMFRQYSAGGKLIQSLLPPTFRLWNLVLIHQRKEASDDIERFEWVARWLGLKEPEAEIQFNPGGQPYTHSDITREHLLTVLEAICEGAPVNRDIWVRNDPEQNR